MSRYRFGGKNNSPAVLYGNGFLPGTFVYTKELVFDFCEVRNSKFWNRNSNFPTLQTSEFEKNFPTRIFGTVNRIGIPLPMGVPEIGTKNQNSQPSYLRFASILISLCHYFHPVPYRLFFSDELQYLLICQPFSAFISPVC
jgi:hypothetical protein